MCEYLYRYRQFTPHHFNPEHTVQCREGPKLNIYKLNISLFFISIFYSLQ